LGGGRLRIIGGFDRTLCKGGFDWLAAWVASIGSLHGWLRQASLQGWLRLARCMGGFDRLRCKGGFDRLRCKGGFDWLAAWVASTGFAARVASTGSATEETWWLSSDSYRSRNHRSTKAAVVELR